MILLPAEFQWRGAPVDVAVPCGDSAKKKALTWMTDFYASSRRLLVYRCRDEWFAFGPPAFQLEMATRFRSKQETA